jgi:hypothetical protein
MPPAEPSYHAMLDEPAEKLSPTQSAKSGSQALTPDSRV